jgi:hypothetical protein
VQPHHTVHWFHRGVREKREFVSRLYRLYCRVGSPLAVCRASERLALRLTRVRCSGNWPIASADCPERLVNAVSRTTSRSSEASRSQAVRPQYAIAIGNVLGTSENPTALRL